MLGTPHHPPPDHLPQSHRVPAHLPATLPPQACSWTTVTKCDQSPPTGSPASSVCANRSASYKTCVLDSPPEDGCAYWSNGCQIDWSVCSRRVRTGVGWGWVRGDAGRAATALLAARLP